MEFDLIKDKKEYSELIDVVAKSLKDDALKLTKEIIAELSENKRIFTTRQYIHSVPRADTESKYLRYQYRS